jgi:WD40 repeat protein
LDAFNGRELSSLTRRVSWNSDPAASPDGRLFGIWTANPNGGSDLRVCDLTAPENGWRALLSGVTYGRVVFLAGGRHVAVYSFQGTVFLFDATTGQLLDTHEVRPLQNVPRSAVGGRDGRTVTVTTDDSLATLRIEGGRLVPEAIVPCQNMTFGRLLLSPDGESLIAMKNSGVIERIDPPTGKVLGDSRPAEGTWLSRTGAPDGRTAVENRNDEPGRVFDWPTGQTLFQYDDLRPAVLLSLVGRNRVAVCDHSTVRVYAVPSGEVLSARPIPEAPRGSPRSLSADGRRLLVQVTDLKRPTLDTYDLDSGRRLCRIEWPFPNDGMPTSAVLTPDGSQVLVGWANRAVTFDVATGTEVSLAGGRAPVGCSPDGRLFAHWTNRAFEIGERATRLPRMTLPSPVAAEAMAMGGHNEVPFASALRFSRDGRYVAGFRERGVVGLWSVADGVMVYERTTGSGYTGQVGDISPDGRWIAQASWPVPLVWEWAAPRERSADVRLPGHTGAVLNITFTPDGKYLLTAGQDGTVLVWDMAWIARKAAVRPQQRTDDELWDDLASRDAAVAGRAVAEWGRRPAAAIERFRRELPPAADADPAAVAALVARLDHDTAAVRDAAEVELAGLAELAADALRPVAERSASAEQRTRARRLLDRLGGVVTEPRRLRVVRAAEVVERVGTPDARRLMADWATGAGAALLTREARAALDRLTER